MSAEWRGAVHLGAGWMIYSGPLGSTDLHAHHALQVIHAESPFVLLDDRRNRVRTHRALVPADEPHGLEADGQRALIAYLDPATRPPAVSVPSSLPAEAVDLEVRSISEARAAAARLGGSATTAREPLDELVESAILATRRLLPDRVRLTEIAAAIGSSPSRLTHRFTASMGLPFSRWILWERLQLAGRAVAGGANLTVAAHAAGFADSAHLNRTFRRMFGVAPSDVAGAVDWYVDP